MPASQVGKSRGKGGKESLQLFGGRASQHTPLLGRTPPWQMPAPFPLQGFQEPNHPDTTG